MAGSLGNLTVSLAANTAEFAADMGKAAHLAAKNMERIRDEAAKAGKAIGLVFSAGVGAAALLVKQAINSADSLGKLAQGAGLSTKAFSELNYVAGLAGVGTEALATSITRLNRNISDAARGTGEAKDAFQALGIQVKDADGSLKNADQIMAEVADKFAGMEDGAGKSALAVMLFGRAGAAMIPMLNEGGAGIERLRQEAQDLGATLEGPVSTAAANFNDNLSRLNQVKKGLANQIMVAVLPALNQFTNDMVDAAAKSDAMQTAAQGAATGVRMLLSTLVATAAGIRVAGDSLGKLGAVLRLLASGEYKDFRTAVALLKEDSADMASVIEKAVGQVNNIWKEQAVAVSETVNSNRKNYDAELAKIAERAAAIKNATAASKEATKVAKAAIDADIAMGEQMAEMFAAEQERRKQLAETKRQAAQSGLDNVRRSLLTERQLIDEDHIESLQKLIDAREERLITEQEYADRRIELERKTQEEIRGWEERGYTERQKFERLSLRQKAQDVFSNLASITAGVAQHSRKLFELNKVAGIANALLNAYEGISLTMAKYPFPINVAMAAAHGIAAFAQVQAIRGATFGGSGGAAPSIAGSTPATPVTPVTGGAPGGNEQTTVINFSGTTDENKLIRRFAELLNENQRNGGRLVIA